MKKRLLILGANRIEIDIVHTARDMGIETFVTDNHTDWSLAPAKKEADHGWDISWADEDKLAEKCREHHIDGILAGFSEARIIAARRLADRLGKPFYATIEQIEVMSNKSIFKSKCKQNNISVPRAYESDIEHINFPVIVKPVDNGGSRGISICHNFIELQEAVKKAKEVSQTNDCIIEEYLLGDEVMIYYTIADGEVFLSAMCDRYMERFHINITQLPVGYYFPSKHLDAYEKDHNQMMIKFIKELKIQNGLLAFQAFFVDHRFFPFDPTYRLDGTKEYHFTEIMSNTNVLRMLINHSLTNSMGNLDYLRSHENPRFSQPCFELPILLKNGIITSIINMDFVRGIKEVVYIDIKHEIGDRLIEIAHFNQMLCRIHIVASSNEELIDVISAIQDKLIVYDENHVVMNIGSFDSNLLKKGKV